MARKKTGTYDNRKYQNDYHRAMDRIMISFNPSNPDDVELLSFLRSQGNITQFIKERIRAEINRSEARENAIKQAQEDEKSLSGLAVPLIHGYEDKEAIKDAIAGEHRIFIKRAYGFELRFDLDTKKLLTAKRAYYYPNPPDTIIIKSTPD